MKIDTFIKNENADVYFLFAILSLSYFSIAIQNLALPLFVLISIRNYKVKNFIFNYKQFLFLSIPFLLTLISFFYSENTELASKFLIRRAVLPVFALFILSMDLTREKFLKGFRIFLVSSVVAGVITLGKGIVLFQNTGVFFHPNYVEEFTIIHHPYLAAHLLIALLLFSENISKFKIRTSLKVLILLLLALSIILSTSRIGQLFLVLYFLYKGVIIFKSHGKKVLIVLITLIVSLILIKDFDVFMFKYRQDFDLSQSPRFIIWKNSFEVIKDSENLIFRGIGIGDYQEKLDIVHRESMKKENPKMGLIGYNAHNQYLEFIITNSWSGILFLLYVFWMIYSSIKSKQIELIVFTFFIFAFFFVECVLNRQMGVYFIGIFVPLFYKLSKIRE